MAATDPATHRQLAHIKQLAYRRGISFTPPRNRGEASDLIRQLRDRDPSPALEIRADRDATSSVRGEHAPSSSPQPNEITGYGSAARWRNTRPQQRF